MYEVLISHLRECAKYDTAENTFTEAADAIEELEKFYKIMADAYETAVTKKRWVPVTERWPEKDGKYLVCTDLDGYKSLFTSIFRNGDFHLPCVTHWMPLPSEPEPPKEELE